MSCVYENMLNLNSNRKDHPTKQPVWDMFYINNN